MRKTIHPLALFTLLTLSACSTVMNNLPGVYSLDIQQGNMISQEIIDQLRPHMTKRQVLYIMGSPMLVDVFHHKRWDYIYSDQPGGKERTQKRVSLFFVNDKLSSIQGDLRPSTLPVKRESNETSIDIPKRKLDKTLWEKITGLFNSSNSETVEVQQSSLDNTDK